MSLPLSESADDAAVKSTEHRNSKKEAFLIGTQRRGSATYALELEEILSRLWNYSQIARTAAARIALQANIGLSLYTVAAYQPALRDQGTFLQRAVDTCRVHLKRRISLYVRSLLTRTPQRSPR